MYNDPNHKGNSEKYHTGKKCIEDGCDKPAGTAWSPYWCFAHNVERIDGITKNIGEMLEGVSDGQV